VSAAESIAPPPSSGRQPAVRRSNVKRAAIERARAELAPLSDREAGEERALQQLLACLREFLGTDASPQLTRAIRRDNRYATRLARLCNAADDARVL
jgi:hypothetical protein